MENINVYITILSDSLRKKIDVLQNILDLTKEQGQILSESDIEKMDVDGFDRIVEKKYELLNEMQELDNGFDSVYKKIGKMLADNKDMYKSEILQMQNLIRTITNIGMELESLEQQNKTKFNTYIRNKRHAINDFKQSNRVATVSYTHLTLPTIA